MRSVATLAVLLALSTFPAIAEPNSVKKVNEKRLVFKGPESIAYLRTGEKVSDQPFSGIAFFDGDNWRAEVTYSNGVLHGPVSVVANNKIISQFEYINGKRFLKE